MLNQINAARILASLFFLGSSALAGATTLIAPMPAPAPAPVAAPTPPAVTPAPVTIPVATPGAMEVHEVAEAREMPHFHIPEAPHFHIHGAPHFQGAFSHHRF